MNIKSLTLKNTLSIEETGELYYDLTAPSFSYKRELGVKGIHYVTVDQAGRIDKIAELLIKKGKEICTDYQLSIESNKQLNPKQTFTIS